MKKIKQFVRKNKDTIIVISAVVSVAFCQYAVTSLALDKLRVKEVTPSEDFTTIWVTYADGHEDTFYQHVKR